MSTERKAGVIVSIASLLLPSSAQAPWQLARAELAAVRRATAQCHDVQRAIVVRR
jgi:hypothetical protein